MGKFRQPMNKTEGLSLINNMIANTATQQKLKEFQLKCTGMMPNNPNLGKLGDGYWYKFCHRNKHRLQSKKGERYSSLRANWSKAVYFEQMYDVIYDGFVEANVATVLDPPVYMTSKGKEVDNEELAHGRKCDIKINHPSFILFADETGCNTSQKKDSNNGGKKVYVQRGTAAQTECTTEDHKFTLMPIISATGEAVMCAIIFTGRRNAPPAGYTTGIDIRVDPVLDMHGDIELGERNFSGAGKYFPKGPTCRYNNVDIPCQVYVSESGGMTADILVSILRLLDELKVFPRTPGGPVPCIILDGHQT